MFANQMLEINLTTSVFGYLMKHSPLCLIYYFPVVQLCDRFASITPRLLIVLKYIPLPRTNFKKFSIPYQGPKVYNN